MPFMASMPIFSLRLRRALIGVALGALGSFIPFIAYLLMDDADVPSRQVSRFQ